MPEAEAGVIQLVQELEDFIYHTNTLSKLNDKPWKVIIASGTGTMALFMARHFASKNRIRKEIEMSSTAMTHNQHKEISTSQHKEISTSTPLSVHSFVDIDVIAIPCVGSSEDLHDQMIALDHVSGIHKIFPTILPHRRDHGNIADSIDNNKSSKRIFGNPSKVHYDIWSDLITETGVTFDLIYTPIAMEILFESFEYDKNLWEDCNLLYYHCGGLEGNESQLGRYRYAKLI
jgi:1-aminocyclopropane-1-carboxylate deaminase/D-cysteine desulfhydrase-like pyridoxal-dependent ACC family enzyme